MDTPLDEFFQKHLPYEIDMMRAAIHALATRDKLSWFEQNAFIETFCLHARTLIEFFEREGDYGPHSFTDADEFKRNRRVVSVRALRRINQQVSHLTKRRTDDAGQKINGDQLNEMHQTIEAEIERFAQHLKTEWRERWKVGPLLTFQWPEGKSMTTSSSVTHYQTMLGS
jgi:hypothetical protein